MPPKSLDSYLLNELSIAIASNSDVTVAFSGGLDSTVLLHLCSRLRIQSPNVTVHAVHVNHGLSKNAMAWEEHCNKLCDTWDIPLQVQHVTIKAKSRTSLEQQARIARYQALEQSVSLQHVILLGQHQDDQAETYLLQLARGAGSEGLSAMPKAFQTTSGHQYVRPLLNVTRQQILDYAQSNQLAWIEDESNQDEHFYRNFIRHRVLPVFQEKWPAIASTISRSAAHHAHSAAVIDEYMTYLSESIINPQGQLDIAPWLKLSPESQLTMLRFWLKPQVSNMPSTKVLEQISLSALAQQDANPECCWGGDIVSRYAGRLYVRKAENTQAPKSFEFNLKLNETYTHPLLPYSIELCLSNDSQHHGKPAQCFTLSDGALRVEFGGFSKECKLEVKRPTKSIKKWLQEWQVPPWERAAVPILMHKDQVLAVGSKVAEPKLDDVEQTSAFTVCIIAK